MRARNDQVGSGRVTALESLAAGREALARGRWDDARLRFEAARTGVETPEALEGLAEAAWWLEDASTVLASRQRAYQLFRQESDDLAAGRVATELGLDHAVFKLELAVASGWFQRAHRLLDHLDPAAEQVWLALREAEIAYHTGGDMARTRALAAGARASASHLGLLDLEMMALALEGLALVGLADVEAGMRQLDEAAAAAVAGEVVDRKAAAAICCFMIFACERVRDIDRASQWCEQYASFCRRNGMPGYLAFCRGHHASVLIARGRWAEAETQLVRSCERLRGRIAWSLTMFERLGELRRRQGRLDEAAALFERAQPFPGAVLGAARVALDRGQLDTALDLVEGVLARVPEQDRMERVAVLDVLAAVQIARGEVERTASAVGELERVAAAVGTAPLVAVAGHRRGQVALATGDAAAARTSLEVALERCERARLPFEASLLRIDLARALDALGRRSAALGHTRTARAVLARLGAARAAASAGELELALSGARPPGGLTAREIQVLRLLARGLGNQHIADELVVSRHTVRRHVSNILTKLGVASRTAAVAEAHDRGLV